MSKDLFDYPDQEPWHKYPRLFKPNFLKTLLLVTIFICLVTIVLGFVGIPKDAVMTTPGLEKLPVPVGLSIIILLVLPLPCVLVGSILGLIPVGNVPYKVKFTSFFLVSCILIEGYVLKELISATMHG